MQFYSFLASIVYSAQMANSQQKFNRAFAVYHQCLRSGQENSPKIDLTAVANSRSNEILSGATMNDANIVSAHTEGNWKTHLELGDTYISSCFSV